MPGPTGDPGEFDDALAIANAGRARSADPAARSTGAGPGLERGAEPRTTDAVQQGAASRGAATRGTESRGVESPGAEPYSGERADERPPERPWFDPWHAPWGNSRHEPRPEAGVEPPGPQPGGSGPTEPTGAGRSIEPMEPTRAGRPIEPIEPSPARAPRPDTPASGTPRPSASQPGAHSRSHPRARPHSPWPDARAVAADAVDGPLAPGGVPLGPEALGRVLAGALTALTDLPSFDTSAMDGWAVSGPGPWRLTVPRAVAPAATAGILAGQGPARPLPDGHAVPIATGARIPPGASAVLRSEHGETTEQPDGGMLLSAPRGAPPGQDIRPRGQECRNGDPLLPPGTPVTPAVLGLAAAAGYDELWTYRRPVVEILVLGDELLHGGLPQDGRIRDALGPMLAPWLRAMGAETIGPRHLADDEATLYEAIAGSTADVVITTGGTAAGPVDHVHPVLRRLGAELLVDGVQVRPGHPMLLARLGPADGTAPRGRPARRGARKATAGVSRETPAPRHLVGLPGNPLAAVSGLLTLAEPLLGTLSGRTRSEPRRVCLADGVHGHPHDTRLVPVACRIDEKGGAVALPLHFNGPAMLRGIAAADALAVIPPGGAAAGEPAVLLDLPWSAATTARESFTATAPESFTATAPESFTATASGTDAAKASDTATAPDTGAHGGHA
ncbi:molybdopterin-binding protein [Streptomyces sp. NPDC053560]|uniref:molybdopterin-binding protein n=1 Tax=Streptomyces sp. NPDC053560 TaxID=3365711 RepID=UPI0037CE8F43